MDIDCHHWRKSNRGRWGLSPTSEGGKQFRRKTLTMGITLCWIKQSSLQLLSFQLQWQFHLICRFHKLTLFLSTHFTGLQPCNCVFVCIHDFALIREGFMGWGLKGSKVKKAQEKCCPFLPVILVYFFYLTDSFELNKFNWNQQLTQIPQWIHLDSSMNSVRFLNEFTQIPQ